MSRGGQPFEENVVVLDHCSCQYAHHRRLFEPKQFSGRKGDIEIFPQMAKGAGKSYFEEVVKEFEKDHPDIDIQIEAVLNDSYKDKIKVMLGTTSLLTFTSLGAMSLLLNLSEAIKHLISRPTTKMTPIGHHSSFNRKLHHLLMKTSNMAYRGKWTLNHSSIIKTFSKS